MDEYLYGIVPAERGSDEWIDVVLARHGDVIDDGHARDLVANRGVRGLDFACLGQHFLDLDVRDHDGA